MRGYVTCEWAPCSWRTPLSLIAGPEWLLVPLLSVSAELLWHSSAPLPWLWRDNECLFDMITVIMSSLIHSFTLKWPWQMLAHIKFLLKLGIRGDQLVGCWNKTSIYFICFIPAGQELAPPNIALDTHSLQLLRGVCQTPAQSLILQNQLVLLPWQTLKVVLKVIAHRRHQQFL